MIVLVVAIVALIFAVVCSFLYRMRKRAPIHQISEVGGESEEFKEHDTIGELKLDNSLKIEK